MTDEHFFEPRLFEIWLVRFRFEANPKKYAVRPALVIQERGGKAFALMLRVTKNVKRQAEYDVILDDWHEAGLRLPSAVRCDKMMAVDESDVDWEESKWGRLTPHDAMRVVEMLHHMHNDGVVVKPF